MANTFKVKTKAAVGTSAATVYTVPSSPSTTTLVLGLVLGNVTGAAINDTVTVESDTSDTETNANVELVTNAPIPAGGSLETLGGGKLVLQTTDVLKVTSDTASSIDATLSIMEIT